jgi:hypothetical protein
MAQQLKARNWEGSPGVCYVGMKRMLNTCCLDVPWLSFAGRFVVKPWVGMSTLNLVKN